MKYDEAQKESDKLRERIKELEAERDSESQDASEIQDKYKELENSFFDIQMENLHLKNELDNLRKSRKVKAGVHERKGLQSIRIR